MGGADTTEYSLLRDELVAYETSRVTAVSIAGTGTGVILSIAMTQSDPMVRGVAALAALAVVWPPMFLIASRLRGIARITSYMMVFLESKESGYHWETRLLQLRDRSPKQRLTTGVLFRPRGDIGGWGGARDVGVLLLIGLIPCALSVVSFLQEAVQSSSGASTVGLAAAVLFTVLTLGFGPTLAGMEPLAVLQARLVVEWEQLKRSETEHGGNPKT